MNIYIVIPAHNEEDTIGLMLQSLENQSYLPKKVVVVNDNSSDKTQHIAESLATKHSWLNVINHRSFNEHIPGSKVINAFYKGFDALDNDYDIVCKFDADIILPDNYLEEIVALFNSDSTIGIAGGLAYINNGNGWNYEKVADKNHVRGPIKAYRKECFKDIDGLKQSIGWDTVDVLLAQYHGWKVQTNKTLQVKHLKPTGKTYRKGSETLQGEALYKMRYGFSLTLLTALKSAYNRRNFNIIFYSLAGYLEAKNNNVKEIVSFKEGLFIRQLRWKGIRSKLGLS